MYNLDFSRFAIFLIIAVFLTACEGAATSGATPADTVAAQTPAPDAPLLMEVSPSPQASSTLEAGAQSSVSPPPTTPARSEIDSAVPPARPNPRIVDNEEYYFPQLLPFDAIRPVYEPEFAPADLAPYVDDELVMGVAFGGEAKAYPVSVLRFREMVNDELAGVPILVTW